jgi:hypothetical protein
MHGYLRFGAQNVDVISTLVGNSCSFCKGALPQAVEIIFEMQRKRSNNNKKNKLFNLQNAFFFFFSFLWTPPTFKASFLVHFTWFKVL